MRHHVWWSVIWKRTFQRASNFIKTNDSNTFYIVIKWHIAMIFSFNENNNEKAFPYQFLKIFKGPLFHCQKFLDFKSLWKSSNLYKLLTSIIKTGGLFIRFFAKAVRKSSKSKMNNKKGSHFNGPSNLYEKFSDTNLWIGNNKLAEIMHFSQDITVIFWKPAKNCPYNALSVQFCKSFKGPSFYGPWVQKTETLARLCYW